LTARGVGGVGGESGIAFWGTGELANGSAMAGVSGSSAGSTDWRESEGTVLGVAVGGGLVAGLSADIALASAARSLREDSGRGAASGDRSVAVTDASVGLGGGGLPGGDGLVSIADSDGRAGASGTVDEGVGCRRSDSVVSAGEGVTSGSSGVASTAVMPD
jgi:hypothetical protein